LRQCLRYQSSSLHVGHPRNIFTLLQTGNIGSIEENNLDQVSAEEIQELLEMEKRDVVRDEQFRTKPWQVMLEPSARALWRTSDQKLPLIWTKMRSEILAESDYTTRQLKRSFNKILETQKFLAQQRDRERNPQKKKFKRKADTLSQKNEIIKKAATTSVLYEPEYTLASLRHRLLPNYAIAKRVLLETQALLPHFYPKRILDFGIGVGSSSAAAMDVFTELEWIHGIDSSRSMRECASLVLDGKGPRVTTDSILSSKSVRGNFDVVLFTFTATELSHVAATLAAAALLWEKLSPNGVFIMIEPGTPDGFNNIGSVRSMLLDCCPPDEEDEDGFIGLQDQCHIIAPCTHNGNCPMNKNQRMIHTLNDNDESVNEVNEGKKYFSDTKGTRGMAETDAFNTSFCSFVHNIPNLSNSHRGDKLSYLVAQKRYGNIDSNLSHSSNLIELLAETYRSSHDRDKTNHKTLLKNAEEVKLKFEQSEQEDSLGLSILIGDKNRRSFGRIMRAPIKKKGHVIVDYCASGSEGKGKIVRHCIGKVSSGKIAPGHYLAARKARWGGFWPDIIDKIH